MADGATGTAAPGACGGIGVVPRLRAAIPRRRGGRAPAPGHARRMDPASPSAAIEEGAMNRCFVAALALGLGSAAMAQSVDAPKVVVPDKLAGYWVLLNDSVEADVPIIARNISSPGCATVSFVVEKNGTTSHVKVQRVQPEGDLVRVAQSMGKHLRFEPTVANADRSRVFSWLIFPFNSPADAAARSAMMQPCVIDKLEWKDR